MVYLNEPQKSYTCVGLMSGTSLDGLDICLCQFQKNGNGKWEYSILKAETVPYSHEIILRLKAAPQLNGEELTQLDYEYGQWLGNVVNEFLLQSNHKPTFVASHGHTIFHNPCKGYTLQIGKGSAIAALTNIPCISDFRSSDVCRGGQGAPLVPIGDKLLFSEFDICLNLGGIANLSFDDDQNNRIAYDVCPCNMLLNHLSGLLGNEYDRNGETGKKGRINANLLSDLNQLDYYKINNPKSLGREWFQSNIIQILNRADCPVEDKLRTSYEHIAEQITRVTNNTDGQALLITGGGANNILLVDLIEQKSTKTVIIPDKLTIDFKEALIFAFLGVLYIEQQYGALKSVTGAKTNSICGCLYY